MSIRLDLLAALRARLPETFYVHDGSQAPDVVSRPTVLAQVTALETRALAPTAAAFDIDLYAIARPDVARDVDQLEDIVVEIIHVLSELDTVAWNGKAETVVLAEKYPGWRFPLQLAATITRTT